MNLWDAAMGRSLDEQVFAAAASYRPRENDREPQPRSNPLRQTSFPAAQRAERRAKNKAARKARKSR